MQPVQSSSIRIFEGSFCLRAAGNPIDDAKLAFQTLGSLLRGNALRQGAKSVSFGSKPVAQSVAA
jgi:hypothetical protein